ncbi:MAG: SDR family oxidoreductase [Clostridiales bacterium]|nr:SDR family oxidoreductase [Clostridiales bacterium]
MANKITWLYGKTVIVTGASSGMGKDIATRLIKEHSCTVIGVARSEAKMKAFNEELGEYAKQFTYKLFDVSILENWQDFAKWIEENNIHPDILINNAGILPKFDKFENYSIEDIRKAMDINFFSNVYSMKVMMPIILKSSDPGIVNVASSAAFASLAGTSVYSASKAALKGLTEAVREETRGRCYVGLVCPGFTKTDIFRNQGDDTASANKAFDLVSTPCAKMVDMIMHGIIHRKSRMAYGFDSKYMDIGGRMAPVGCSKISSTVMKKSKLPLFDDVFKVQ